MEVSLPICTLSFFRLVYTCIARDEVFVYVMGWYICLLITRPDFWPQKEDHLNMHVKIWKPHPSKVLQAWRETAYLQYIKSSNGLVLNLPGKMKEVLVFVTTKIAS
jgi:hypothetical protein